MRRLGCKMKSNRKRILIYDAKLPSKKSKKDTYNRKILNSKAKKSLSPIPMTQVQKLKIKKNLNLGKAAMKTKLTGTQKLIDPNLKVKRTVLKASQTFFSYMHGHPFRTSTLAKSYLSISSDSRYKPDHNYVLTVLSILGFIVDSIWCFTSVKALLDDGI